MFKLKVSTVKSIMEFIRENCDSYYDQIEIEYSKSDTKLSVSVMGKETNIIVSSSEGYFDEDNKKEDRYFDTVAKAMENFNDEFNIDTNSDDVIIEFNSYDIDY